MRILFVSTALADRTWFVGSGGKNFVLCGPLYAGGFSVTDGRYRLITENPVLHNTDSINYPVLLYPASGVIKLSAPARSITEAGDSLLALSGWTRTAAAAPSAPGFDDNHWLTSEDPAQMGLDGHIEPEAWYRTTIDISDSGYYKLECAGGDRATVFVDGKWIVTDSLYKGSFTVSLDKGRHVLAIYTAHDGRDKLPGYTGPLGSVNAKGLSGEVWLKRDTAAARSISQWKFIKANASSAVNNPVPDSSAKWVDIAAGADAFEHKAGCGWFESRIAKPRHPVTRMEFLFKSADEDATVFIGGHRLLTHKGWNQPFRVPITVSSATKWPLVLDVFVENHSNEGGIDQPVVINEFGPGDQPLKHWRMRGGTPEDEQGAQPFRVNQVPPATGTPQIQGGSASNGGMSPGAPVYYTAHFVLQDTAPGNTWRVNPGGLDHGYVWVNGHNLGHYPEKIAAPGIYIPAAWLKKGDNELKILDESGALPGRVSIWLEKAASRSSVILTGGAPASVIKNASAR